MHTPGIEQSGPRVHGFLQNDCKDGGRDFIEFIDSIESSISTKHFQDSIEIQQKRDEFKAVTKNSVQDHYFRNHV